MLAQARVVARDILRRPVPVKPLLEPAPRHQFRTSAHHGNLRHIEAEQQAFRIDLARWLVVAAQIEQERGRKLAQQTALEIDGISGELKLRQFFQRAERRITRLRAERRVFVGVEGVAILP